VRKNNFYSENLNFKKTLSLSYCDGRPKTKVMTKAEKLISILKKYKDQIAPMFDFDLNSDKTVLSDCSINNKDLNALDLGNVEAYSNYASNYLAENKAIAGVGGYVEERIIYQSRPMFQAEEEPRNIHLGIDVSAAAETILMAPLDSKIHSFANNDNFGDYGPTIILEHELDGEIFYTLYGHLSKASLIGKAVGQIILKGTEFAALGNSNENGHWPPHLHFQLMTDMQEMQGDFPGVCRKSELEKYKQLCPNPNYILWIDKLAF